MNNLIYRPEIDGLRAVAVVLVILFHGRVMGFDGGFIGVDIFFVISGYLITSIIAKSTASGQFTLTHFYERRLRRIIPILFFVILCTYPAAWLLMIPRDFLNYSESLLAAATFSSNIFFWRESGYFDTEVELKPLLHTWSLAVEEQYYILFPTLLVYLIRRHLNRIIVILFLIGGISLASAEVLSHLRPSAAFYLLPTRIWELLLGAVLALTTLRVQSRLCRQIGSTFGCLMIGYSAATFDQQTRTPGLATLIPTVGAGAVIFFATTGTVVHRILSTRVFVGLGLISYSAYLWHQPAFAFLRYRHGDIEHGALVWLAIGGVLLASALSWHFIEQPFRKAGLFSRSAIFRLSAFSALLVVGLGLVGVATDGAPQRMPPLANQFAAGALDVNPRQRKCQSQAFKYLPPKDSCVLGDASNISGVLLGDSHSDAIAFELSNELMAQGMGLRHMWHSSCPPILSMERIDRKNTRCREYNNEVYRYVSGDPSLHFIVMYAWWAQYYNERYSDGSVGGPRLRIASMVESATKAQRQEEFLRQMRLTMRRWEQMGKKVVLVYPTPEMQVNVPTEAARRVVSGDVNPQRVVAIGREEFDIRVNPIVEAFDSLAEEGTVSAIPVAELFCDNHRCSGVDESFSLYRDKHHLSNAGARKMMPLLLDSLRPVDR